MDPDADLQNWIGRTESRVDEVTRDAGRGARGDARPR